MATSGKTLRADGVETRARLKTEAQKLFAVRGFEGVSIQDIVSAAGQRNNASLRYYFGTKAELVRELVVDGAKTIDERRQALLNELEGSGELSVRSVMDTLSLPLLELRQSTGEATYIRMIANLQLNNRALLREALGDTWNVGYRRAIEHLRRLLNHIPGPLLEQRISLVSSIFGNAAWAAWEAAQESTGPSRFWSEPFAVANVCDALQHALEGPPSEQALELLNGAPCHALSGEGTP